ncbi:hypothetical protein ACFS07_17485 [Undibacterium arcticum]
MFHGARTVRIGSRMFARARLGIEQLHFDAALTKLRCQEQADRTAADDKDIAIEHVKSPEFFLFIETDANLRTDINLYNEFHINYEYGAFMIGPDLNFLYVLRALFEEKNRCRARQIALV